MHAAKILAEMGIGVGDAVGLAAGGFEQAPVILDLAGACTQLLIDLGDKGFVGERAGQATGLGAAHPIAERGDQTVLLRAELQQEAVLIVSAHFSLVA